MGKAEFSYQELTTFTKEGLMPREEMLEVEQKKKKLTIGIPCEDHEVENRVPLTPEAVQILVDNGHDILLQEGAGNGANYSDKDYSEAGGFIVKTMDETLKADVILKIGPLKEDEIEKLKGNQLIISSIQLNGSTKACIKKLMQKKVIAIACESIKDENNGFPVERSMNAIAGNTSILVAAEYLSKDRDGKGVLLGGLTGITPAEVVILGAGTASEFAARAAIGLGAFVKVFDDSIHKLQLLQEKLGHSIYTSIFQPSVLQKALRSADVVIGAVANPKYETRFFVSEDMVREMKDGAVIVDVSVDHGGCFETSEIRKLKKPAYYKHGVLHYCVPNIASRVSRTASIALSNVFAPLLLRMGEVGGVKQQLKVDVGLRNGVYIYNGILTNKLISSLYHIPSQNIDLLLAAF